ncbi:MAG: alpha-hydroxy acid oxidase [Acidimicrobiia bacterium]
MDVDALEARAREVLDPMAYDYYASGADDEITVHDNRAAWQRVRLLPRVLRDVSQLSTETTVLGTPMAAPILIAPMAAQRLAHADGEVGMARAAAATGTVMVVSTMATATVEDVAAAAPDGTRWFQLYVQRDRDFTADLLKRVSASWYGAVVLTVDLPVLGRRRRDEINQFEFPEGITMANLEIGLESAGGSALAEHANAAFAAGLVPDDIGWVAEVTGLPVLVKGVLRADDAERCVAAGAAGVVVSNHGGRQLDGAIATADALPAIVDAVAGRVPVLVDGGIRGGYDVLKAIGMGASAALVGRPFLWGLATGGSDGAAAVMKELIAEFERAMALCGCRSVDEIDGSLIAARGDT